ncbi:DsbA family protein [Aeromicrobium flavum]|nr:thioredoxin domain-containing protein [Aeromicrobium flavum]
MALGDVDAPVVMIEYSEFQCPFCGKYSRETAPKLVEKYVDQGLLRIEFRDFPYLGDESDLAARAARAAAEQDSFWPFHERLFAEQPPPNSGRLDRERLSGIAKDLGLDTDRFLKDMDSDEVAAAIKRDRDEGMAIGVTGTPAFLINDRVLMGALPTEDFVETIDAAIKDARG